MSKITRSSLRRLIVIISSLILGMVIATFIIVPLFRPTPAPSTNSEQTPEADLEATPSEPPSDEEAGLAESTSPSHFSTVIDLGTGSLPLRSQHALTEWQNKPLVVLTDDDDGLYVVETSGTRHLVTKISGSFAGPTIAANSERVVVAWVTPSAILAASSSDLISWSDPVVVGVREQTGGPIPSADWTGTTFAVVWVDAPKANASTGGMDGVGKLQVAVGDGVSRWQLTTLNSTTAIAALSGSTLVWRDDRNMPGSRWDSIRMANINGDHEVSLCPGYDPAIAVNGEHIAIGYHLGSEAHLRTTPDGGKTWDDQSIDESGKFVSPLVTEDAFGAIWVDYVDAEAARDARNNAGHRTTAIWDGVLYPLNGGATFTLQGQGGTIAGTVTAIYQVDGRIFLAQ